MIGFLLFALGQYPAASQITKDGTSVVLEDYASLPTSTPTSDGPTRRPNDFEGLSYQLARANVLASEPPDAPQSTKRFFVIDQNGMLYILDKATRQFTPYLNFGKAFANFANAGNYGGFGTGLGSIVFDPAYAKNGKFYTAHTEKPGLSRAAAINPPDGPLGFESVLTEWTDTNIKNSTFEGSTREILRVGFSFVFHPMGDLLFNPRARPGQADYGNLYIAMGDGTAGERPGVTHTIPQRLDALQGKILRITPDITLRPKDALSASGRYRIPSTGSDPNPFVSVEGARPEIYAYGFRNPHRLTWDRATNTLIADDIGNGSWEEVNIVSKGSNYGWAEREGPEQVFTGGLNNAKTGSRIDPPIPFPSADTLIVDGREKPIIPVYPSAAFSHRDGASIGSGFVYRGKLMPGLVGKYVFSDIVTGRLFYADFAEMRATHGMPTKLANIHELQVVYKTVKRRMFDVVADAYADKQGIPISNSALPGMGGLTAAGQLDPYGVAYGGGRADVRLSMDGDGELYAMSKSDGMIRKLVAAGH